MTLHPVVLHHVVNTLGWPSLRPLQEAAIAPVLRGADALLLAPTAGGKTEAAVFPLLSRMAGEDWRGLTVLYVCPLRALLNNLEPRISSYTTWLGRRAALWHGDTGAGARRRISGDPPDVLLTTPESLELLSVFTTDPQFMVLHGRDEIGAIDPTALTRRVEGARVLALAGRSWTVRYVDWGRRRVWVEPSEAAGTSQWSSLGQPLSYAITDGMRRVLLGADPLGVQLSRRADDQLLSMREERSVLVDPVGTVVVSDERDRPRWWTWADGRANAVLAAALDRTAPGVIESVDRYDNRYLRLTGGGSAIAVRDGLARAVSEYGDRFTGVEPDVSEAAVQALKFAELLPPELAHNTLAARLGDHRGAALTADRPIKLGVGPGS